MTTDLSSGRAEGQVAFVPKPTCIKARRAMADPDGLAAREALAEPDGLAEPGAGALGTASLGAAPLGAPLAVAGSGSGRGTARETLLSALSGVRLGSRDRQFLSRLVSWDKRNAVSVSSLLWRARQAGREEAALTPRQLETVLSALSDAALYRHTGAASSGCWDCGNIPGGRCAEHARDNDRARAYAEVAAALTSKGFLSGNVADPGRSIPSAPAEAVLPQPREFGGFWHRTPVAS